MQMHELSTEYDAKFVTSLYRILFDREPDPEGFAHYLGLLQSGVPPHELVSAAVGSEEFAMRQRKQTFESLVFELPNLVTLYPADYHHHGDQILFLAKDDGRINRMEQLITTHGYYDRFGVWSAEIDNDKRNIAQFVECFGAKTCLEIGCFNGPVLSVLNNKGIEVTGVDLSHLAFVVAFPNIRKHLIYGDLLSIKSDRQFDCILLFDVLEHINPLKLDEHIRRLKQLLAPNGVILLNSPMFGDDPTFGTVFQQDVEEWVAVGDSGFFRSWPCDAQGWPVHGHMVFASPPWWTTLFEEKGLTRQTEIETHMQDVFKSWFSWAPARKSFFVLGHTNGQIEASMVLARMQEQEWF